MAGGGSPTLDRQTTLTNILAGSRPKDLKFPDEEADSVRLGIVQVDLDLGSSSLPT